jgi:hypothetical protein
MSLLLGVLLLVLQLVQDDVQSLVALLPEPAEVADPRGDRLQRPGLQTAGAALGISPA